MTLHNYNPHRRYKERAAQRMSSALGFLAFMLISILIGFWLGKQYGAEQLIVMKDTIALVESERDNLQEQLTQANADAQTANKRYEQLQEEVQSIISTNTFAKLEALTKLSYYKKC